MKQEKEEKEEERGKDIFIISKYWKNSEVKEMFKSLTTVHI